MITSQTDVKKLIAECPPLVRAIISVESAGNPGAISNKSARGLMQLMDATGREWFKILKLGGIYNPYNPRQNVTIGTAYIHYLLNRYGQDRALALAAYNGGLGRVDRLLRLAKKNGKEPTFKSISQWLPEETRNYVPKILLRLAQIELTDNTA